MECPCGMPTRGMPMWANSQKEGLAMPENGCVVGPSFKTFISAFIEPIFMAIRVLSVRLIKSL